MANCSWVFNLNVWPHHHQRFPLKTNTLESQFWHMKAAPKQHKKALYWALRYEVGCIPPIVKPVSLTLWHRKPQRIPKLHSRPCSRRGSTNVTSNSNWRNSSHMFSSHKTPDQKSAFSDISAKSWFHLPSPVNLQGKKWHQKTGSASVKKQLFKSSTKGESAEANRPKEDDEQAND